LDLQKATLYGFEKYKSETKINQIIDYVQRGGYLPAVPILEISTGTYELSKHIYINDTSTGIPIIDGGHNRALAQYIMGRPLYIWLVSNKPRLNEDERMTIGDIVLLDDDEFLEEFLCASH